MGETTFGDLAALIVEAELALLAFAKPVLMAAIAILWTTVLWGIYYMCRATRRSAGCSKARR